MTTSEEPASGEIKLSQLSKSYGKVAAVRPLDMVIPGGTMMALLGPSGCGKTTTLRMIAGFEVPDSGDVFVNGRRITHLPPNKRQLGMVFQNYSLFPHMNVKNNVSFGLRMARVDSNEIERQTQDVLRKVQLEGFGDRSVTKLSGGQQQRVALARSIVTNPSALLLDEPLGALDKNLRETMQFELRQLQRNLGITSLIVTHDQEEALTISDFVAVMDKGRIIQMGTPQEVYNRPNSRFVADFLGAANLFEVTSHQAAGDGLGASSFGIRLLSADRGAGSEAVNCFCVRPEKVQLAHSGRTDAPNTAKGRIIGHVFRGSLHAFQIETQDAGKILLAHATARDIREINVDVGTEIVASWRPEDLVPLSQ